MIVKSIAGVLVTAGLGGGLWLWKDYGAVIALIDGAVLCMSGL